MLRGNIAANSLKILWTNIHSIKCYDKSNINLFTLCLRVNFWWGLIYFDQYSLDFRHGLTGIVQGHNTSILVVWLVKQISPKWFNVGD